MQFGMCIVCHSTSSTVTVAEIASTVSTANKISETSSTRNVDESIKLFNCHHEFVVLLKLSSPTEYLYLTTWQ